MEELYDYAYLKCNVICSTNDIILVLTIQVYPDSTTPWTLTHRLVTRYVHNVNCRLKF